MILGTQEKGVTRMKCVLLIGNNVLIIHRVKVSVLGLCLQISDSGLFSWISLTVL